MELTKEDNKELVRSFEDEVWNEGNLDVIEEYLAKDFVQHERGFDAQGPDEWRRNVAEKMYSAFPDISVTFKDVIAEDDKVVIRVRMRGTHEGEFMDVEPTGNEVEVDGVSIARVEDGKIAERWIQSDVMGLREQLGVE